MSGKTEIYQVLCARVCTLRASLALMVVAAARFTKAAFDIQMLAADGGHAARPSIGQRPCTFFIQPSRDCRRGRFPSAYSILPPITNWPSLESREFCHASR